MLKHSCYFFSEVARLYCSSPLNILTYKQLETSNQAIERALLAQYYTSEFNDKTQKALDNLVVYWPFILPQLPEPVYIDKTFKENLLHNLVGIVLKQSYPLFKLLKKYKDIDILKPIINQVINENIVSLEKWEAWMSNPNDTSCDHLFKEESETIAKHRQEVLKLKEEKQTLITQLNELKASYNELLGIKELTKNG